MEKILRSPKTLKKHFVKASDISSDIELDFLNYLETRLDSYIGYARQYV